MAARLCGYDNHGDGDQGGAKVPHGGFMPRRMTAQNGIIIVIAVVVLLFGLSLVFGCFYTVGAGERAVLLTFGKPDMQAMGEGLHWKWPLLQSRVIMNVQTQKYAAKADAASTDLQIVTAEVTLNYHLDHEYVPVVYQEMGVMYADKVIQPAVQEIVKECVALHKAEELITKREAVKQEIDTKMRARLASRHFLVETVNITHFDFSIAFNDAIEKKVTAEQNALAAKNKLEQVKFEADQAAAKADGEARSIRAQIQAVQQQGGEAYLQMKTIEKWDGKLPMYTGSAVPFIDLAGVKAVK